MSGHSHWATIKHKKAASDAKKGKMEIKGISDGLFKQFMEIHLDRIFPISKK